MLKQLTRNAKKAAASIKTTAKEVGEITVSAAKLEYEFAKRKPGWIVAGITFAALKKFAGWKNLPAFVTALGSAYLADFTADQVHAFLLKKEQEAKALSEEFVASEE